MQYIGNIGTCLFRERNLVKHLDLLNIKNNNNKKKVCEDISLCFFP